VSDDLFPERERIAHLEWALQRVLENTENVTAESNLHYLRNAVMLARIYAKAGLAGRPLTL